VKAGFNVPLRVKNYRENPVLVKLNQILMEGQNILNKPVSVKVPGNSDAELPAQVVLPNGMELGEKSYAVELVFDETVRVFLEREFLPSLT
jgi:Arc/MetJ family transcription regulator